MSMLIGNLGEKTSSLLILAAFYRLQLRDELCVPGQNILFQKKKNPSTFMEKKKKRKKSIFSDISMKRPRKRTHKMWARNKGKTTLKMCTQPAIPIKLATDFPNTTQIRDFQCLLPHQPRDQLMTLLPFSTLNHYFPSQKPHHFWALHSMWSPACLCLVIGRNLGIKQIQNRPPPSAAEEHGGRDVFMASVSNSGFKKKTNQQKTEREKEGEQVGDRSKGISIFHKSSPNTKDALGCHLVTLKTKDQHF